MAQLLSGSSSEVSSPHFHIRWTNIHYLCFPACQRTGPLPPIQEERKKLIQCGKKRSHDPTKQLLLTDQLQFLNKSPNIFQQLQPSSSKLHDPSEHRLPSEKHSEMKQPLPVADYPLLKSMQRDSSPPPLHSPLIVIIIPSVPYSLIPRALALSKTVLCTISRQ